MSAVLLGTALLFRAIQYYYQRYPARPSPEGADDAPSPSRPAPTSLTSPTRRRAQPRTPSTYSPRLTNSGPAPALLASTPSPPPGATPSPPSHAQRAPPRAIPGQEPVAYPFAVSPPRPVPLPHSLPTTPSPSHSAHLPAPAPPPRRTPSIASRRSSVSSSVASSPGFHPAASAVLAPVLDSSGSTHARESSGQGRSRNGSLSGSGTGLGLGRPSAPPSRLTPSQPATAPAPASAAAAAAAPASESKVKAKRSFTLPFGRRKPSQQAAPAKNESAPVETPPSSRVPVVERLRSFSRR